MSRKLFVKICGITRPQDAELAGGLGASALGFVFWPNSPRCVSTETAKAAATAAPPHILKVGVFVDQPADEVARKMDEVGLDAAQLHGHESPEYCRHLLSSLRSSAGPRRVSQNAVENERATGDRPTVIKAIAMRDNGSVSIADFDPEIVLLVDAHDPIQFGGTGKIVNWDAAREISATRRTILAGGLNATNIKLAVRSVRPFGVDVSSGVESAPGVKDPHRLRTFFEALHD